MQNGSKFIPPNANGGAKMPPKVDHELISKASQIACNLVGFPCEITLFEHPSEKLPMYRLGADLEPVQINIYIYSYLKEFNVWYLGAHQVKAGPNSVTCFKDLISALHDFSLHWNAFSSLDPRKSAEIVSMCKQANQKVAEEIIAERKAKNQ